MDGNAPKNLIKIRTQEQFSQEESGAPFARSLFLALGGFQESAFSAFLRFSYFIIIAISLCPLPRLWRILPPVVRPFFRSHPPRLSRSLRLSRASFARFARGMVNRDGILPAAVSASHAAPLAASRHRCRRPLGDGRPVRPMRPASEMRHTEEARRRRAPRQSITNFYKIQLLQFYNTRLAPRTLSHSRGDHLSITDCHR